MERRSSGSRYASIVCHDLDNWDKEDHHILVLRPQHEEVQGERDYGQREKIRWKQQNSGQDCVKDQEVDGQ